jgi:hypothetical protein
MEVGCVDELVSARFEPVSGLLCVAFRAGSVTAGVIPIDEVVTIGTAIELSAHDGSPARENRLDGPTVTWEGPQAVALQIVRAVLPEDVRHLRHDVRYKSDISSSTTARADVSASPVMWL